MVEFMQGELITASKLNEIIEAKRIEIGGQHFESSETTVKYNYFLTAGCYIEIMVSSYGNATGRPAEYGYCNAYIKHRSNGSFVEMDKVESSPTTPKSIKYTIVTPGEYEIEVKGYGFSRSGYDPVMPNPDGTYPPGVDPQGKYWEQRGWGSLDYIYIKQAGTANVGDFLVLYDDPAVSMNRIRGEHLTAKVLNSGRVTTIP